MALRKHSNGVFEPQWNVLVAATPLVGKNSTTVPYSSGYLKEKAVLMSKTPSRSKRKQAKRRHKLKMRKLAAKRERKALTAQGHGTGANNMQADEMDNNIQEPGLTEAHGDSVEQEALPEEEAPVEETTQEPPVVAEPTEEAPIEEPPNG